MKNSEKIKLKYFPLTFKPINACLGITTRCIGNCAMCKIHSINPSMVLSFANIRKIVDDLAGFGIKNIGIIGGEPLLHHNLWEIADYIKSKGITRGIITNGCLVNSKNILKLKQKFTHVEISLDGSNQEINDAIRFKGSYEGAMKAINLVKKHQVPFNIRFTIQKGNVDDIISILELCERQQISLILSFVEISGYGNSTVKELQKINPESLRKAISYIEKNRRHLQYLCNNYEALKFVYHRLCGSKRKMICWAPFVTIPIFASGDVYPCSVIENKLGNIKQETIKNIYFSEKGQAIRKAILCKDNPICNQCVHLNEFNETFNNTFSYRMFLKDHLKYLKKGFKSISGKF